MTKQVETVSLLQTRKNYQPDWADSYVKGLEPMRSKNMIVIASAIANSVREDTFIPNSNEIH